MRRLISIALLASSVSLADDLSQWEERAQFDCNGPFEHFSPADVKELEGFRYEFTGGTVKVRRVTPRKGKQLKLGLLAGIKDADPETQALVKQFLASFEQADVDAIVIGGDSSAEPDVLDQILSFLAASTKRPMLVIAGNMERGAALNYALIKQHKAGATHLLNMDTIRRYDGDGIDVVSLGGYHDRAFLHLTGGCVYKDKDLDALRRAADACDDPAVLLTHGPPRQKGQQALDYVPGADNVGDARLTSLIKDAKIAFGIHGHILEAAGWGTDLAGHHVPPKKPQTELFVDQGSANPLPWKMNDKSTAYGLAMILTFEGKKASYEVLRGEKPKQP